MTTSRKQMKTRQLWYVVFNLNLWSYCPNLFKMVSLWGKSVDYAIISNIANTFIPRQLNYLKCCFKCLSTWTIANTYGKINSTQVKKTSSWQLLKFRRDKIRKREKAHPELRKTQQKFSFILYCCFHGTTINLVKCAVYIQNILHFTLHWTKNFLNKNSNVLLFPLENKLQYPYPCCQKVKSCLDIILSYS